MLVKLFRWVNVLLIIYTVLVYLSPLVHPNTFWPMAVLGPTYPWILLVHILFIGGWLLVKKWYFVLSVLCLAVGFGHFQSFVGLNFSEPLPVDQPITILSYNLYMLRGFPLADGTQRGNDFSGFIQFMEAEGPIDVLCTQETSDNVSKRLAKKFDFPHYHHYPRKGTTIFSQHPFLKTGTIGFGQSSNSCVWADLEWNGQRIRIYNVHLQSNRVSDDAIRLAEEGDLQERETWRGVKGMIGKYRRAAQVRAGQAEKLAKHLAESPYPVIICGDFNDTPLSYPYREILEARSLQDAFKVQGFGLGTTYNGKIPALRIDYTLVDPALTVQEHRIPHLPYSDHYPLLSRIGVATAN